MVRLSPALLFLLLLSLSCCTNSRKDYRDIVAEWIGKEILFPDSMEFVDGSVTHFQKSEFTILAYFDSVGCTGCKMKLSLWKEFMQKADSLVGYGRVKLIIVAESKDTNELNYLVKESGYQYGIVSDRKGEFNRLNKFPKNPELQSFLLNQSNEVVIIGNPTMSGKIEKLFLDQICHEHSSHGDFNSNMEYEYEFGLIKKGEETSHVFNLKNEREDTIVIRKIITSCDCTSAYVSQDIIQPGDTYDVTVVFRDTVMGDFLRSVTLFFENNKPEIRFELSGEIVN